MAIDRQAITPMSFLRMGVLTAPQESHSAQGVFILLKSVMIAASASFGFHIKILAKVDATLASSEPKTWSFSYCLKSTSLLFRDDHQLFANCAAFETTCRGYLLSLSHMDRARDKGFDSMRNRI